MASGAPSILVAVLWGLILAGLVVLVRGWRGRQIDDHPLCRRCGYDLVANARATNCPECGRALAARGAIRVGHRRRRTAMLCIGALTLIVGGGGVGMIAWLDAHDFRWITIRPLWLLVRDTAASDPTTVTAAQKEILARLSAGRLSQAQINGIINDSLVLQSDLNAHWPLWRGDFIEASWLQGNTGNVPFRRYLETALDQAMYLRVRPRVRQGQPVNVDIRFRNLRLGRDQNRMLFMINQAKSLVVDGRIETELPYRSGMNLRGSESISGSDGHLVHGRGSLDVPAGQHSLGIAATFLVVARPGLVGGMGFPATMPSDWQFEITRQFESPIEVLAADSPGVRLVSDENLSALVRRAVTPYLTLRPRLDGSQYLVVWVNSSDPPVGVAFDIIVRDDESGREQWFGTGWKVMGGDGGQSESSIDVSDATRWMLESKSLQIILRPNASLAEPTAELFEIWGKELIYPDHRIMGRPAAH